MIGLGNISIFHTFTFVDFTIFFYPRGMFFFESNKNFLA